MDMRKPQQGALSRGRHIIICRWALEKAEFPSSLSQGDSPKWNKRWKPTLLCHHHSLWPYSEVLCFGITRRPLALSCGQQLTTPRTYATFLGIHPTSSLAEVWTGMATMRLRVSVGPLIMYFNMRGVHACKRLQNWLLDDKVFSASQCLTATTGMTKFPSPPYHNQRYRERRVQETEPRIQLRPSILETDQIWSDLIWSVLISSVGLIICRRRHIQLPFSSQDCFGSLTSLSIHCRYALG